LTLGIKFKQQYDIKADQHVARMEMCVCGSLFNAGGNAADVQQKLTAWRAEHENCAQPKNNCGE